MDEEKKHRLSSLRIDARESCKECWARYFCGGGCYAAAWLTNRDVSQPDLVKCELVKHLILLSMQMIAIFEEQKPEVLSHLREVFLNGLSKSESQTST